MALLTLECFLKSHEHPPRVTQIFADEATNVQKGRKEKKENMSFLLWAIQLPQDYSHFIVLSCIVLSCSVYEYI